MTIYELCALSFALGVLLTVVAAEIDAMRFAMWNQEYEP